MTISLCKTLSVVGLAATLLASLLFSVEVWAAGIMKISSFDAVLELDADGSFMVLETIVYDFADSERHGIFRSIPLEHPQPASSPLKRRVIDVDVQRVFMDGAEVPYEVAEQAGFLEVKIGDPSTIITGSHTYDIAYTVNGALSYYDTEKPELYWDVTGTNWPLVIKEATVRLIEDTHLMSPQRACYQGQEGVTLSCGSTATSGQIVFTAKDLLPGDGMTIAQGLNGGVVEQVILEEVPRAYYGLPVLILLLLAVAHWLYQIKTKHKLDRPVVAEYEPYPGVLPMYTGVLIDGRLDPRDITAGLLYLAEQGFIKIKKTQHTVGGIFGQREVNDLEVTLLKQPTETSSHFHQVILDLIFDGTSVNSSVILRLLNQVQEQSHRNRKRLQKLKSAVADDVVERGFYEHLFQIRYVAAGLAVFVILGYLSVALSINMSGVSTGVLVIVGLVVLLFVSLAVVYRRRTRLGYEALNHLKGFKEFLSVSGKDRFKFHNSPQNLAEEHPEKFLEYLPYAVALGVEKEWAEVFADITIENPSWYDGNEVSGFDASNLTTSLGAFSTAFASSAGGSGASGGGSVGGGAGGGGGGSW